MRQGPGGIAAYQQSRVVGSSPEQLVVLLYEGLLTNLRRAAAHIARREYEEKSRAFDRATDIIFELVSSLDVEQAGELGLRLSALYSYFIGEIGAISRSLDLARLEQLTAVVASLHEAWAAAARAVTSGEAERGAGAA
jgi:flagellar protein FliS